MHVNSSILVACLSLPLPSASACCSSSLTIQPSTDSTRSLIQMAIDMKVRHAVCMGRVWLSIWSVCFFALVLFLLFANRVSFLPLTLCFSPTPLPVALCVLCSGDWLNNQAQGRGKYIYVNGNRYEGQWKNNQMDGHGKLWFATGDRYEGDFRSNRLEGHGKYTLNNGDQYEGELKQNMMHGYGICTYANGDRWDTQHTHTSHAPSIEGVESSRVACGRQGVRHRTLLTHLSVYHTSFFALCDWTATKENIMKTRSPV